MTTASNYSDGDGNGLGTATNGPEVNAPSVLELERLPRRASSLNNAPHRLHGRENGLGLPRLVIFPDAAGQIAAHANSNLQSEVGGVLLGNAYRSKSELYVDVQAALPVQSNDHGPIHFTFNADAWSALHRDRAERYPDLSIVGWFHTHPGLGVFFSGDDVVVHSAAFVLPWHTALVIDPLQGAMGAFAWQNGELAPLAGFHEILESADANVALPWKLRAGEIWTESYLERMASRRLERDTAARESPFGLSPTPLHSLLAGVAASILLSLLLLVGAILPLSRQNEALQEVVGAMVAQTMVEANASGSAVCPGPDLQIFAPLPDAQIPFGQEITIVGAANVPGAAAYRLDVRPQGEQTWWALDDFRRSTNSRALLNWDTSSFAPGNYELRLGAVDRAGDDLQTSPACLIRFTLASPEP